MAPRGKIVFVGRYWMVSAILALFLPRGSLSSPWYDRPKDVSGFEPEYFIQSQESSWWQTAESGCGNAGGKLLSLQTKYLPPEIFAKLRAGVYWMGGFEYNDWRWTDGSSLYTYKGYRTAPNYYDHIIQGNSALQCHLHCGPRTHWFGLSGTRCYCLIPSPTLPASDQEDRCPGNLNERCGDVEGMSVYKTIPLEQPPSDDYECGFIKFSWNEYQYHLSDDCTEGKCAICNNTVTLSPQCPQSAELCYFDNTKAPWDAWNSNCLLAKAIETAIHQDSPPDILGCYRTGYWIGLKKHTQRRWIDGRDADILHEEVDEPSFPRCLALKVSDRSAITPLWTKCSYTHKAICETMPTPGMTTKTPGMTTKTPGMTTKTPGMTTKTPEMTTKTPGMTTKTPGMITKTPGMTTKTPGMTTKTLWMTTKTPGGTTKTPGGTTKTPGMTTKTPGMTTKTPGMTTKNPGATTKKHLVYPPSTTVHASHATSHTQTRPTTKTSPGSNVTRSGSSSESASPDVQVTGPSRQDGGKKTGMYVGISLGIVAAVVIAIVAALLMYRRRLMCFQSKHQSTPNDPPIFHNPGYYDVPVATVKPIYQNVDEEVTDPKKNMCSYTKIIVEDSRRSELHGQYDPEAHYEVPVTGETNQMKAPSYCGHDSPVGMTRMIPRASYIIPVASTKASGNIRRGDTYAKSNKKGDTAATHDELYEAIAQPTSSYDRVFKQVGAQEQLDDNSQPNDFTDDLGLDDDDVYQVLDDRFIEESRNWTEEEKGGNRNSGSGGGYYNIG